LEGSGLNAVLNPVIVDGRRAWADFAGGGYALFEEIHPSRDHFDFVVQHIEPWRRVLVTWPGWDRLDPEILNRLDIFWRSSQRAALLQQDRPPIASNAEAWDFVEALPALDFVEGQLAPAMLKRLSELAEAAA